jgi:hypothetical protein
MLNTEIRNKSADRTLNELNHAANVLAFKLKKIENFDIF